MKNLIIAIAFLLAGSNSFSQQSNAKVLVYFFHGTHRCTGCINAEKGTVNALNALYKTQLNSGIIKFESVNFDEDKNKALVEKYEAGWNKLIFVKNDKSGKIVELTEQAFAFGVDNQEAMNNLVKSTVDNMLK
jgi:hypothetical protein